MGNVEQFNVQQQYGITMRPVIASGSLGIDPELRVYDQANRPVEIARGGRALTDLF